jgi:glycerate-2-kinase
LSFDDNSNLIFKDNIVLKLINYHRFHVVAIGKAAPRMLTDFLGIFPKRLTNCLCIYPENYPRDELELLAEPLVPEKTRLIASSHPLVTERSFLAGKELLKFLQDAKIDDLTFFLISGGSSALVEVPTIDSSLYRQVLDVLYRAGLTIHQLNTIRIALSDIKGGKTLQYLKGSACACIISDVPGDHLSVIGSGLTVPRAIKREEISRILNTIDTTFLQELPSGFNTYFDPYKSPTIARETKRIHNLLVGSNHDVLIQLEALLRIKEFNTQIFTSSLQGSVREVSTVIYSIIEEILRFNRPVKPPACLLFGGETTVSVGKGAGIGGRNQELCLTLALMFRGLHVEHQKFLITAISFGTDGIDGNSNFAGAIVDSDMITVDDEKLARKSLKKHDSTNFLLKNGKCLIKTGPTGTNVMDVILILVTPREGRY